MNIANLSRSSRIRIAQTLVGAQFLSLGAMGVVAITRVTSRSHSYLAFEVGAILFGIMAIGAAGIALRPSMRVSPIPKVDSPLIEIGIYKRVRHPMYLGTILIGFGVAGYADSWFSWLFEAVLIINLNIKARFEDALLREIHPESVRYQMQVSRILPCLGASCRTHCSTH